MPIDDINSHAARIAVFDLQRQRQARASPGRLDLVEMGNRTVAWPPSAHLEGPLEAGSGHAGSSSGSGTVRCALVLLTLGGMVGTFAEPACPHAVVAAGGLGALGQPLLASGVALAGCLPTGHAHQHESATHRRKVLCRRLLKQAFDRHFVTERAAIVQDIEALAALLGDTTLQRDDLAAVGACLGRVRERLNLQLAYPLRAEVSAAEKPGESMDEPMRVLRLAMLRNQLEPVNALDRLLTATIIRANRVYIQCNG